MIFRSTVVTFFIVNVVGVALQMKQNKNVYVYTNFNNNNKKTFSIILSTQRFKNCFHRIVGNEYLLESGSPCHAIVYIPTVDFGQNLRETMPTAGDLKPFAQRYFLIS